MPPIEDESARGEPSSPSKPSPSSLAQRLREARWGKGGKSDRWLALVPVAAFVLTALLMLPRSAPPDGVPLPSVDARALAKVAKQDADRAARVTTNRLPGDVLAVGSAVRALHVASTDAPSEAGAVTARRALDEALVALAARDHAEVTEELLALRAVQLQGFLREVEAYETTGQISRELHELGGAFIERMTDAGWVSDHRVLLDEPQRSVAFKLVWNAVVGVEGTAAFQPTLDEQRALYTLYLAHPHPPEAQGSALEAQRDGARTKAACERAERELRMATEMWRVDKIKRLGAIDPEYPTSYALGAAYYLAGRFDRSIEAYRTWLEAHPEGPFALRARNQLRAALEADGAI